MQSHHKDLGNLFVHMKICREGVNNMPQDKNRSKYENMRRRERKLPRARHSLGFWEKWSLACKGKRDGKANAFDTKDLNGRQIRYSQHMLREIEWFQEFRDSCYNRSFIIFTDIDSGKIIRSATFTSWIEYLNVRIEYAGWRIIPEEKIQEYRRWKIAADRLTSELANISPSDSHERYTQQLKNDLTKHKSNMQTVITAAFSERKDKLTSLCGYLEEKISMVDFMEAYFTPVFRHTNSRIGYYFGVASRYLSDLKAEDKPHPDELFIIVNDGLVGAASQLREDARSALAKVQEEVNTLTADKIKTELDEAASSLSKNGGVQI